MAFLSSDASPTSSCTSSTMSDEKSEDIVEESLWSGLTRRAKTVVNESPSGVKRKDSKPTQRTPISEALVLQNKSAGQLTEGKWKRQESVVLQKGFRAIASSLSLLSDTLGNALEEGLNLVETKATNFMHTEPRKRPSKENQGTILETYATNVAKLRYNPEENLFKSKENAARSTTKSEEKDLRSQVNPVEKPMVTKDTQLKASRDVAMAMATKAKLLLRELKDVKTDLAFTTSRCKQLEDENKRLRENIDKGERHEEDDLVRLQLEALLAEKARLIQENASYARENQFLHEIVQYHLLRLRSIGFSDETLMLDDERSLGASAVDMDLLPLYPEEKDIIALEETVKITNQHVV